MKKKIGLLFILLTFIFIGCQSSIKDILIVGPSSVSEYQTIQYSVTFDPIDKTEEIDWESSNEEVASVDENGQVTGIVAGEIRLFARLSSNQDVYDYIDITITPLVIEDITITGKSTLEIGEKLTYSAIAEPAFAPNQFSWSSSNSDVLTINNDGQAEALQIGEVTIKAISLVDINVFKEMVINIVHGPLNTLVITSETQLSVGSTLTLKAFDGEEEVTDFVNWQVDDEQKATIDAFGLLKGLQEGIITITATSKINQELTATKEITIIFRPYLYYQTKILLIDNTNQYMELLNCPTTKFNSSTKVLHKVGEATTVLPLSDLLLGMENVYAQIDVEANIISAILIDDEIGFSNIRVGIRKYINDISLDETLYHDDVEFSILEAMNLQTFDGLEHKGISEGTNLTFSYVNGKIEVKENGNFLFETSKRLILDSLGDNENIQFLSITRGNGSPYYHGNMEIAIKNGRLLVINDVNLEKYLYKVLPSEMPSSFGLEALKAQAIAARTYAYMDVINKATQSFGYTVDDSVKSQVYNNSYPNEISKTAVNETAGQIMTNNGSPISAFYYSTSSGLTASGHEVWISSQVGSEIPYLIGKNLTKDEFGNELTFDYQDEESMLTFFKTIKMTTPDSALSNYHRWKVTFTKLQLTTTINTNLRLTYNATPQLVLTKNGDFWLSQAIPSSIGEVTNIYVGERGTSGVVISLIIETTTGIYKIINQYNIRFTIRPKDAGSTVYRYYAKGTSTTYGTNPAKNDSILLSGFFALEISGDYFTFYGGGNGHGVGMSQYGAYGLANDGKTHSEILQTYYSNIAFANITYNYIPINNYEDYFN
ncbi:MAG: SpoIID/LytB domain-containing protein [Bacilli bacterium]